MLLAPLSNTKLFLEITATTHDTLLSLLLAQISKRIETFLNRDLEKKARTLYFDAGRKMYFLPAYPIDSSAVLTVVNDTTTQVLNTDYYIWYDEGHIEFTSIPSYTRPKQIAITWTGGYTNTLAVPQDIQMATIMQVAFVFRRRKDIGLSSIQMPDGSLSVNAPTELLPEVKAVLKSYRKTPGMR